MFFPNKFRVLSTILSFQRRRNRQVYKDWNALQKMESIVAHPLVISIAQATFASMKLTANHKRKRLKWPIGEGKYQLLISKIKILCSSDFIIFIHG